MISQALGLENLSGFFGCDSLLFCDIAPNIYFIYLFIILNASIIVSDRMATEKQNIFHFWPFGFQLGLLKSDVLGEWLIYLTIFFFPFKSCPDTTWLSSKYM